MEKFYDKVLLLLAVALLGVGLLIYLNLGSNTVDSLPLVENRDPYQPIEFVPTVPAKSDWEEPSAQSAGPDWLFQVFTPPKIWIDENGEFTAEALTEPVPFGISLLSISKQAYRFQFQSYLGDDQKPVFIVLDDLVKGESLRVRLTEDNEDFKILSYELVKEEAKDSQVAGATLYNKFPTLTLLDKKSDQVMQMVTGQTTYLDKVQAILESDSSGETYTVEKAGDQFVDGEATFVVGEVNEQNRTVLLQKTYETDSGRTKQESQILSVSP